MEHLIDYSLFGIFWGRMPHWMCIGSIFLVASISIMDTFIALGYFRFVTINNKILHSRSGQKYFRENLFTSFRGVFWSCAIKSLTDVTAMFIPFYLAPFVARAINTYWITKAVKEYKKALPDFTTESITIEQAQEEKQELVNLILKHVDEEEGLLKRIKLDIQARKLTKDINQLFTQNVRSK